jgi:hypothetical protein
MPAVARKVTKKMADWMDKQVKERPSNYSKGEIEQEMDMIEMSRMSKKDLMELSKGKSRRAESASLELDRRGFNKLGEEPEKAASTSQYRDWAKSQKEKEVEGMAKGGMVKKKPAAKKAPAKTKSRSNTYNKFYGK